MPETPKAWMPRERWEALVRGAGCPLCAECQSAEPVNEHGYTVATLGLGFLRLSMNQFPPGYCVLICTKHVREPYHLTEEEQAIFFSDMMCVAQALERVFSPVKMNFEILGNLVPHLHVHIKPRYYGDPAPGRPVGPGDPIVTLTPQEYEERVRLIRAAVYHQEILSEIRRQAAQEGAPYVDHGDDYIGTAKPCYLIRTPVIRQVAKDWIKRHPDLTPGDYLDLLNSLSQGKSHNEFSFVGILLEYMPKLRKTLDPRRLDKWLDRAEGWSEVDSICQSNFNAEELLANWKQWKSWLVSLCKSSNVHKRRASLVLLTRPVRDSVDAQLSNLAFATIDRLKREEDILITKAISWLLRDLIKNHHQEVETYLRDNQDSLPKIAIRETRNKLKNGRKSGK